MPKTGKTEKKRKVVDVTVAEIHEEFDSAVDRIIEEANKILEKEVADEKEVYLGLEQLGFNNASDVKAVKQDIENHTLAEGILAFARLYAEKYPDYKFIDDSELNRIRRKYGLVQGQPEQYKGQIPKDNAKALIDCRIDYTDIWAEEVKRDEMKRSFFGKVLNLVIPEEKMIRPTYQIIATLDLMTLRRNEYVDEMGMIQYRIPDPDPIVVTPVKGGWLIISKWGAEEDIKEVE